MYKIKSQGNFRPFGRPRSIVRVNSIIVPFRTWDVSLNGYAAADTFDLTCPFRIVDTLKGVTDLINTPDRSTILLTQPDILVEVFAGYPRNPSNFTVNDLTQLMYGYLDTVDFYLDAEGERVQIAGRNQVGPFMDTKTTDKFPNQTSSTIVGMFAAQQGLQTQITPTYTLAGTYYDSDHVQLTTDITQWDLMNYLALQEGFTLRVVGNTLYFGPRDSFLKPTALPYTWGQNLKTLHLGRTPHASKDIKVEVITWQPGKKTRIVATATNPKTGTGAHQGWVETYYFPGLTRDQAQQKAQSILDQLSMSEIVGDLTTAGNDQQDIYQPIQLYGTGLGLTQQYWPTKATHSFGQQAGNYGLTLNFSNLNMPTNPGGI